MRRLFVFFCLLAALWLTACSGEADALPTQVPAVEEGGGADSSPRPTDNPADLLPPTWTPQPTADSGAAVAPGDVENAGTPAANQTIYLVQAGDTLGTIATEFGVSIDDLARANNISDLDHIEVGQQLIIP
ncbi:MAG: hypothetical protein Fur0021_28170 [Candidatus Promineifilaceae bacterium]